MYEKIETVEQALEAAKQAEKEGLNGLYPAALRILAKTFNDEYDNKYRAVVAMDEIVKFFTHMRELGYFGDMPTRAYADYMNNLANIAHEDE